MEQKIIIATESDLIDKIRQVIREEDLNRQTGRRYTQHAASKFLGLSHVTVKKYVERGLLKVTPDNRITEAELRNFLTSQSK